MTISAGRPFIWSSATPSSISTGLLHSSATFDLVELLDQLSKIEINELGRAEQLPALKAAIEINGLGRAELHLRISSIEALTPTSKKMMVIALSSDLPGAATDKFGAR